MPTCVDNFRVAGAVYSTSASRWVGCVCGGLPSLLSWYTVSFDEVNGSAGKLLAEPLCDGKTNDTCSPVRMLYIQDTSGTPGVTSSNDEVIYGVLWALIGGLVSAFH